MMTTKVQKGSNQLETPEEKEKLEQTKKKWATDIDEVDKLLKLLAKTANHKQAPSVRALA